MIQCCDTITVCVQPVWPIVLYVKILLLFTLQCRTDTLHLQIYVSVCSSITVLSKVQSQNLVFSK